MLTWEFYMSVIAFLGSVAYYIQAFKIFRKKIANGISLMAYMLSVFTSVNWLVYGIIINDISLIGSGGFSTLGAILVVIGALIYG